MRLGSPDRQFVHRAHMFSGHAFTVLYLPGWGDHLNWYLRELLRRVTYHDLRTTIDRKSSTRRAVDHMTPEWYSIPRDYRRGS